MNKMKGAGAAVLALALTAGDAAALQIRIDFSGQVQSLTSFGVPGSPLLDGVIPIGAPVSGTVVYGFDPTLLIDTPTFARYSLALQSLSIGVAGLSGSAAQGYLDVNDDHNAGGAAPLRDGLFFGMEGLAVSGDAIAGVPMTRLQMSLLSADLNDVIGTGLPAAATVLALWDSNLADGNTNFIAWSDASFPGQTARFSLTGLTVTQIDTPLPTPATLPLAVGGVVGVAALGGGFGARRRRSQR